MAWFDRNNLRFVLETETDADSPTSEELISQFRENFESLFLLLFGVKEDGTLTSDPPNDTTGVLTDSGASFDTDEHNNRCVLMRTGTAAGNFYQITDTTGTQLIISGTNLYSEGIRSGDQYIILYNIKTGVNTGHNHNGWNSENVTPAAASLIQSMLKTSTGEVSQYGSTGGTEALSTLPGGSYGFYPQLKYDPYISNTDGEAYLAKHFGSTSYVTPIYLVAEASCTLYAQQRYVTSSGESHWIFILRDYQTGEIVTQWQSADHPCFGNGGKPGVIKHPFLDVFEENGSLFKWFKDPDSGLFTMKREVEIIVMNPNRGQLQKIEKNRIIEDENLPNLTWLESFNDLFEVDELAGGDWPDIPVTVGLPKVDEDGELITDYRFIKPNSHIEPLKKIITKPDLLKSAKIKNKSKAPA